MSRFDDPAIVTCAISGALASRDQCPAIHYTPEEYAAEARRAVDPSGELARSNGELVTRARAIVEGVGRRAATVEDARALLGAPRRTAA